MARFSARVSVVPGPPIAAIHGVLNVDKPPGWTSHDVVAKLRGLLKGPKIGHAGTLDPAATGVLPLLIGKGTRIAEYLLDWDKEYLAVLRLGETTDTQDATGAILERRPVEALAEDRIRAVISGFQGTISQLPPMYSAVKIGGVPLYKAARSGRTVSREERRVVIHRIVVTAVDGRDVSLRVACSKGTYIRTLCADIGAELGVGGHLLRLARERVGPLRIHEALSLASLVERVSSGRWAEELMSLDAALSHLPVLIVEEPAASRATHGMPVPSRAVRWEAEFPAAGPNCNGLVVRLKDATGRLLGVGRAAGPRRGSAPSG